MVLNQEAFPYTLEPRSGKAVVVESRVWGTIEKWTLVDVEKYDASDNTYLISRDGHKRWACELLEPCGYPTSIKIKFVK
jgi:hypothetical protein